MRLSDKLVEATEDFDPDGIPVGTFNADPPPIANSGGLDVGIVDSGQTFRTVQFFGDLSFAVDPDSGGTLTHTWTIPSGGGAFQSGSTSADENPVMEINVGHWLIRHDVEDDDNGAVTTQYIMVVVHNDANPPYECVLEPMEGDKENGWGYRVQLFEDATEADIPYGSYAFLWVDETIAGVTQSFGSPVTGRSHIKCVGVLRREETFEDGRNDTLTFEVISPLARLGETPGFSKVMERNVSPDAWSEVDQLTTLRARLQLILFYCNLNNAGFDVIEDADMPSYDYPLLFLQKDSPLGQIRELTSATQGQFVCDRRGRFMFVPVLNLMTRTARGNRTTSYVFSRDDILDIQVSQEHWRPVETFRLKGFSAHPTDPSPVFAKYPGNAPGQGNQTGSVERIICQNSSSAYFFCGLYGAMEDGWFVDSNLVGRFAPRITITTPGSYDLLDFYGEWIEFDFSLRKRGIDLSAFRYELVRASVTYEGGTARCVFELQAETFGEPGVDDTPPTSDVNVTDWTTIWSPITFPSIPFTNWGLAQMPDALVIFAKQGVAINSTNLRLTHVSDLLSTPSYGVTNISMSGQILLDQVTSAFSPRYIGTGTSVDGVILSNTRLKTITGAETTTPTITDRLTLRGTAVCGQVQTERKAPGWFIAAAVYADGVYVTYSTDYGVTWSTETRVGGNTYPAVFTLSGGAFKPTPSLWVSSKTAGLARLITYSGSAWTIYQTTNYGASWSALGVTQAAEGGNLVSGFNDDTAFYRGQGAAGGAGALLYWDGSGDTDVSIPEVVTGKDGMLFLPHSLAIPSGASNKLLASGSAVGVSATNRLVYSIDGGANWITLNTTTANNWHTLVATASDGLAAFYVLAGDLWVTSDWFATAAVEITDHTADLGFAINLAGL